MLTEIKKKVPMELRRLSKEHDFIDCVIETKDLDKLTEILTKYMGHPAKKAGKLVKFEPSVQKVIDSIGGLREDQTFYYIENEDEIYYAALWPWESDPLRITLKAGVIRI